MNDVRHAVSVGSSFRQKSLTKFVGKGRTFLAIFSVMSLANGAPSGVPDLTTEGHPDGSSLSSFVLVVRVSATLEEAVQPQRSTTRLEEVSQHHQFQS
jgi:hypothetical protein